jgi:hypothetical protein
MQDASTIAILTNAGWSLAHNTLTYPDCSIRLRRIGGCHRSNPFQWVALTGVWEAERSIAGVHSSLRSLIIATSDRIETEIPEHVAMA